MVCFWDRIRSVVLRWLELVDCALGMMKDVGVVLGGV